MAMVIGCPVYAEQGSQSLYSYVMDTYSKDYVDNTVSREKLELLQSEYSLAVHANLQAESFEYVKYYAETVESGINDKIDIEIESTYALQQDVANKIEENLTTLSTKDLSTLNRQYSKYQENIDSLLADKTSLVSLFSNPTYEKIDISDLELSMQEQQDIISYNSSDNGTDFGLLSDLKVPFDSPRVLTSHAGFRIDPIEGGTRFHNATDYAMVEGTKLYSLFNGTVTRSDNVGDGYGESIKIDCGNGIVIHYAHMSKRLVSVGDKVTQNQLIGLSGNTGRSTGPHLHLSLFYKGEVLDVERLFT